MTNANEPVHRTLTTQGESREAILEVIGAATRELCVFDASLAQRGFESPALVERLRALLVAGRAHRIRIALHEPELLERTQPRLIALKRQFPAAIEIHRTVGEAANAADAFVIADDHGAWHQLHRDHARAVVALHSPADASGLVHRFAEIWSLSEPAVGATTLGL